MPFFETSTGTWAKTLIAIGVTVLTHSAFASPAHRGHARPASRPAAVRNLPDSFLPVRATTVEAVARQIEADPKVRRHYAHQFQVPEARVADYLRQNLVASRLNHTGQYTVFLVRPNSLIYPVVMTIPEGSRVFALRSGPAVLTWGDGNPFKRYTTPEETRIVKAPPRPHPAVIHVAPSSQTLAPVQVQETIVPSIVVTPVFQPASPLTAQEQAPAEPSPAQQTANAGTMPAPPPTATP